MNKKRPHSVTVCGAEKNRHHVRIMHRHQGMLRNYRVLRFKGLRPPTHAQTKCRPDEMNALCLYR